MGDGSIGDGMTTNKQFWVIDPEDVTIPIQGDCGHNMSVALARVGDGREFACPTCGARDRLDAAAIAVCRAEIAAQAEAGKSGDLAAIMKAYLDQVIDAKPA
jgi:hypothetical protein